MRKLIVCLMCFAYAVLLVCIVPVTNPKQHPASGVAMQASHSPPVAAENAVLPSVPFAACDGDARQTAALHFTWKNYKSPPVARFDHALPDIRAEG